MQSSTARKAQRTIAATSIYGWGIGIAFLFVAFSSFPDHKLLIALSYLVVVQTVAALSAYIGLLFVVDNDLSDAAERKTRHAILLAAERSTSEAPVHTGFWGEVDDRVAGEMQAPDEPLPWWKAGGLIAGSITARLVGDVVGIGLVAILTR
jgi:hypothetical protein